MDYYIDKVKEFNRREDYNKDVNAAQLFLEYCSSLTRSKRIFVVGTGLGGDIKIINLMINKSEENGVLVLVPGILEACRGGQIKIVKFLLEQISYATRTSIYYTLIKEAALGGHIEMIKFLKNKSLYLLNLGSLKDELPSSFTKTL